MSINRYIDDKFISLKKEYLEGYGHEYKLLIDFINDFLEKLDKLEFDHFEAFETILSINDILREYQFSTISIENINKNTNKEKYRNILNKKYEEIEKDTIEDEKIWCLVQ